MIKLLTGDDDSEADKELKQQTKNIDKIRKQELKKLGRSNPKSKKNDDDDDEKPIFLPNDLLRGNTVKALKVTGDELQKSIVIRPNVEVIQTIDNDDDGLDEQVQKGVENIEQE